MTRVVAVQMAAYTDNLWAAPDGALVEGSRLPYPYFTTEDGTVLRQDFWNGTVTRVVGFTSHPERRAIDLRWDDAWAEPQRAVGMYVVTSDAEGQWGTWPVAVASMEAQEVDGDDAGR